ncbi:DinB family protein [Dermatobacter hominis]|uniref:DinB family protein n=1 Tax=Dermatobacter hominis TaxID=2884263 RepID=UPI001D10ABA3|nr:DinB family protein [Dermatobacter hominis]UDY35158.1 DinB family protein [Dermatobacter hominis]
MDPTTTEADAAPALDDERADLLAELATVRAALAATVDGLGDEQAGEHPTASALCLGGLIKHVASVEEAWMRFVVDGPSAMSYELPDGVTWDDFMSGTAAAYPQWAIDREADFQMQPGDTITSVLDRYERAAARTEEVVASVPDLSASHQLPEAPWNEPGARHSVRRVLVHVIAETAQHAGHAEIIRETIDGRTTT